MPWERAVHFKEGSTRMKRMVQSFIKTMVSTALATAVCAAWAPGAVAQSDNSHQNENHRSRSEQHGNMHWFMSHGEKHYWVNGREFATNIRTGKRRQVYQASYYGFAHNRSSSHLSADGQRNVKHHSINHPSYISNGEKHYWVNGLEFAMTIATGKRREINH